jgi:ubiquitin carboxyl-terminal hydrolase 7
VKAKKRQQVHCVSLFRFVGHFVVKTYSKIGDLIPQLCRAIDCPLDEKLEIYEEVKPSMINTLKLSSTVKEEELGNGDILIFQKLSEMR